MSNPTIWDIVLFVIILVVAHGLDSCVREIRNIKKSRSKTNKKLKGGNRKE